ncbi:hypothetical protein ACFV6K_14955, partial [Streptomyces sp. NPDC059814]
MTLLDLHAAPPLPAPATVVRTLYPLVSAEAGAEAAASATGAAVDPADLEQTVWLRLLERLPEQGPPTDAARWVRDTVRGEARRARRTARHERPYRDETAPDPAGCPERGGGGGGGAGGGGRGRGARPRPRARPRGAPAAAPR